MATTTVIGTNIPATDAAAVQAAVDLGGTVELQGNFSFEGLGSSATPVVTITRSVSVVGVPAGSQKPKIKGGVRPFFVRAPGAAVSIDGIHFEHPAGPVNAAAAESFTVTRCRFELIDMSAVGLQPDHPDETDQFGTVTIADNEFENTVQATNPLRLNAGFTMLTPNPVRRVRDKLTISGNVVSGFTAQGLNVNNSGCPTKIARNQVTVGPIGRSGEPDAFVHAIRVAGAGAFEVEGNVILACDHANAAGIRVGGTTNAVVQRNEVRMSVPAAVDDNTLNGNKQSAGIVVEGTASGNVIRDNVITGRARVAMSVTHAYHPFHTPPGTSGNPDRTTFRGNDATGFTPSFKDAEVSIGENDPAPGATPLPDDERRPLATVFAGPSGLSLSDEGVGTVSIEWDPPADIVRGTPLSSAQLNATANRSGAFTYSPPAGTVLQPGNRELDLTFMPSEPACAALYPSGIEYSVRMKVRPH